MMNRGANSKVITEDLILQIFSRLPEKSISRFLCLSKQWKSLICSQYFVDLFHSMSSSKPHLLVVLQSVHREVSDWKLFSSHQSLSSSPVADTSAKFSEYHIPYTGNRGGSYASGLIYFLDDKGHGLCNPSTGQYTILPPIKHSYGFLGFDPIGKQFKVLIYKERRDDEVVYEILTLGTIKERQREVKWPYKYVREISNHICINGVLYFDVFRSEFLSCFDVRSEKFMKIEYPDFYMKFVNYKGKLGLVDTHVYDDSDSTGYYLEITIWVLEDFDKVEWTKHLYEVRDLMPEITDTDSLYLYVIGVTDSDDIVLAMPLSCKPFYVFCFNPSDPLRLRRVKIEGVGEEEENSDNGTYMVYYFMNHRANLGFDIMKKTATCMYEQARTEVSTSSSTDNLVRNINII